MQEAVKYLFLSVLAAVIPMLPVIAVIGCLELLDWMVQ